MPSQSPRNHGHDEQSPQTEFTVAGWASLGPKGTINVDADTEPEDIPDEQLYEALREDLRERGFSDDEINKFHLEIDVIEERV